MNKRQKRELNAFGLRWAGYLTIVFWLGVIGVFFYILSMISHIVVFAAIATLVLTGLAAWFFR